MPGLKQKLFQSFFWSVFSCIQIKCWKIRTRKNSAFGNFSCSMCYIEESSFYCNFQVFDIFSTGILSFSQKYFYSSELFFYNTSWFCIFKRIVRVFPESKILTVAIKGTNLKLFLFFNFTLFIFIEKSLQIFV